MSLTEIPVPGDVVFLPSRLIGDESLIRTNLYLGEHAKKSPGMTRFPYLSFLTTRASESSFSSFAKVFGSISELVFDPGDLIFKVVQTPMDIFEVSRAGSYRRGGRLNMG